jgi:hypothetical protein
MAIDVSEPTATPTRTPGPPPTATAIPGETIYDDYEPNYDLDTAANVGVGQPLELNFNPWPAGSNEVDNDFFRLYVKVGEQLRIETAGLAQGLDTNLILLRADGQAIAGNDDCKEADRSICLDWAPDYTGVAYLDENNNKAPDPSEGIAGVSIRLLDGANNSLLGQTFSNNQGYAALTVTAASEVRLSIPYLGYNQGIKPPGEEVTVRLAALRLPSVIP